VSGQAGRARRPKPTRGAFAPLPSRRQEFRVMMVGEIAARVVLAVLAF
jgi:hypothetical protein